MKIISYLIHPKMISLFIVCFLFGFTLAVLTNMPINDSVYPIIYVSRIEDTPKFYDFEMEATAYTAGPESTGKYPGHPAYGITKSGTRVQEGRTIAVDPDIIPLGTPVEIFYQGEKLGDFIAEDTGRLIKGMIIDIYMEDLDRALEWGRRMVTVRVPANYIDNGDDAIYD